MKNLLEAMRNLKTENTLLKETGEWDDTDDEMSSWKEDMRNQATYLASKIDGGKLKSVNGFDKYQGPFAVVETPKHGDVTVWFDQEDDTGFSFNVKVAHVGWISGDMNHLYKLLNQDEIPENEIIGEKKEIINEDAKFDEYTARSLKHIRNNIKDALNQLDRKEAFDYLTELQNMLEEFKNSSLEIKEESEKVDAEEFVKDTELMKKHGIWDGKDETYPEARKRWEEIKELAKEFK